MLASGHSVAELPLFLAVGAGHEQKKGQSSNLLGRLEGQFAVDCGRQDWWATVHR